jgi:hypothetical protein
LTMSTKCLLLSEALERPFITSDLGRNTCWVERDRPLG